MWFVPTERLTYEDETLVPRGARASTRRGGSLPWQRVPVKAPLSSEVQAQSAENASKTIPIQNRPKVETSNFYSNATKCLNAQRPQNIQLEPFQATHSGILALKRVNLT